MRWTPVKTIWLMTVLIIAAGLVALYSATFENVRVPRSIFYDQLLFVFIGLFLMGCLSRVDYRRFKDFAYPVYVLNIILLITVLVSGRLAMGAQRWLSIGGINFQPSEFSKLATIIMLARYYSTRHPRLSFGWQSSFHRVGRDLFLPLALTSLSMLLIFQQPDLGTAILIFGIFLAMLFVSGIDYKYYFGFLLFCASIVPLAWGILKDYQKDRLLVFLNPNIDPLGAGYTIIQSKIAVGSGRILGKGWLSGTQNQLNFLPERHTDFIFSVLGEEWGLAGTLFVLACYLVLILAALKIASRVKDLFAAQTVTGIAAIITLQTMINIGMVIGMFPIVGLTLPLMSYGRSSFLIIMVMLGIILNIGRGRDVV